MIRDGLLNMEPDEFEEKPKTVMPLPRHFFNFVSNKQQDNT